MDRRLVEDGADASTSSQEDGPVIESPGPERAARRPAGAIVLVVVALLILVAISGWLVPWDGAASAPSLSLTPAYALTAPAGGSSALYLSVINEGGADDLVGVRTTVAERATLHRTGNEGGLVVMSEVPGLPVPEGGTLVLQPGGSHVMLEGLAGPLAAGDQFEVTLAFERSAPTTVSVQVVAPSQVAELVGTAG